MILLRGLARLVRPLTAITLLALSGACDPSVADEAAGRSDAVRLFPGADRPVATIVSNRFSTEARRDDLGEARMVMDLARIGPGSSVADIGAGEGYYTLHLAERVGARGRVLAEDIDRAAVERLGLRVQQQRRENVSIQLGTPDNPKLPASSFDHVLMIHMYHEVAEPYAFLWNLRPALRAAGSVIVVDADRPTGAHGTPPALLFCEFAAVGFRLAEFVRKPEVTGYFARFEAVGPRPAPAAIKPCRLDVDGSAAPK